MELLEQKILQRHLAKFIVDEVFNTINDEDILRTVEGKPTYKGAGLTDGQIAALSKEAKQFSKSTLYEVLRSEMLWHAKQRRDQAKTEYDLIAANLLFYLVDVLTSKTKKIAELT